MSAKSSRRSGRTPEATECESVRKWLTVLNKLDNRRRWATTRTTWFWSTWILPSQK